MHFFARAKNALFQTNMNFFIRTVCLLCLLCSLGCTQKWKTEKEEKEYWEKAVFIPANDVLISGGDKQLALYVFDSLLKKAEKPTEYIKAMRHGLLSNYYYYHTQNNVEIAQQIDSALSCFNTSHLQDHYPVAYMAYLLRGAEVAYRLHNYNKAIEYYFKAKKTADAHLEPCERSAYTYHIAMVLYLQQKYTQAKDYFQEAFETEATCSRQDMPIALRQQELQSNIGLCFIKLKGYDSALAHFKTALTVADKYRDTLGAATLDMVHGVLYGNMAKVYMMKNDPSTAEELFKKSISLNARPGYENRDAVLVQLQLADLLGRQKRFTEMVQQLETARRGLDTLPNLNAEADWNRLMTYYYSSTRQSDAQTRYLNSYVMLRDSIAEQQKQLSQADIMRQLSDKEQQLQITRLTKDKEIAQVYFRVALLLAIMAAVIIFLVYRNNRRSRRTLITLTELNEEIKRQKAALEEETLQRQKIVTESVIKAQEIERSVIGLELHDNVNQVLTTVKLQVEMAKDGLGDPGVILTKAVKHLQECIAEIRSLSKRLSAPTLGKISVKESVIDLVESINLLNKTQVSYSFEGLNTSTIDQEVHLTIYRIVQEQLNNILKHSGALEASIQIVQKENKLHLSIRDNGKGFDINNKLSGIGIMNMRTRAENLNGSFSISSRPDEGCRLQVVIPLGVDKSISG